MTCHHGHGAQHSDSYPELNYSPGAKWIKDLTRNRINNFHGGHYSDINLSSILFTHRLDGPDVVSLHVYVKLNELCVLTDVPTQLERTRLDKTKFSRGHDAKVQTY